MKITSSLYTRNKYLFNIAFVFKEKHDDIIDEYRSALEKLAKTLYELGACFLSLIIVEYLHPQPCLHAPACVTSHIYV